MSDVSKITKKDAICIFNDIVQAKFDEAERLREELQQLREELRQVRATWVPPFLDETRGECGSSTI